ncbi:MAG TPA: serine protease [Phenylobacterium sp.]|nr:serine protease [Phenylobacterium sp.]
MIADLAVELIHATVQIEQPLGDGTRTVGTGFLINAPTLDGRPRTVLVTANHVLQRMPNAQARIGFRIANPDGSWRYAPQKFEIRDADGAPRWTKHPSRDVAAISISAPEEFAKAAIPTDWLAGEETFSSYSVGAGDQMMALGFPRGLSANPAGFPILRAGRVASFPLAPAAAFPTFLLDFTVFPGNSGGPVFMAEGARRRPGAPESQEVQFIAGLLTQQVELNNERLEIGIVTHARYIRETLALLDNPLAEVTVAAAGEAQVGGAKAASALEAVSDDY